MCGSATNEQEEVPKPTIKHFLKKLKQEGAIVVVAACNDGYRVAIKMLGNYKDSFTVGSIRGTKNSNGEYELSDFSGWDANVNIHALGENIYSAGYTDPRRFTMMTGTSMATPKVAGVFAKLWEIHPEKSADELIEYLLLYCTDTLSDGTNVGVVARYSEYGSKTNVHKEYTRGDGANQAKVIITNSVLNTEAPNCLSGVVVGCPLGGVCGKVDISDYYKVSEEVIESADDKGEIFRITGYTLLDLEQESNITIASLGVRPIIDPTPTPTEEDSSSIGPIVGGVVGGLAVIAFLVYWFVFRKPTGYSPVATNYPKTVSRLFVK